VNAICRKGPGHRSHDHAVS